MCVDSPVMNVRLPWPLLSVTIASHCFLLCSQRFLVFCLILNQPGFVFVFSAYSRKVETKMSAGDTIARPRPVSQVMFFQLRMKFVRIYLLQFTLLATV